MIYGNIKDINQINYLSKNEDLKIALNSLNSNEVLEENRKYSLSNNIYTFVNKINTKIFDCCFEAHKKHIDIFYVVKGKEDVYFAAADTLEPIDSYDCENDVIHGRVKYYTKITLYEGDYIVLFPEDCHAPGCGNGEYLEKKVIKLEIK